MHVQFIHPDQAKPLRHRVLWPHIPREEDCSIDIDHQDTAFHLGTFHENEIVAIGSFFEMSSAKLKAEYQYRLRAMATDPDFRGTGTGRLLIDFALTELKKRNVDVLWCDARINATGFYERLGFKKMKEIYEVPLIGPHQFMWIEL